MTKLVTYNYRGISVPGAFKLDHLQRRRSRLFVLQLALTMAEKSGKEGGWWVRAQLGLARIVTC